jgi:hypothetical protein
VDSFLQQLLEVLKVASHSVLEVLLSVSNICLVHHLTSNLADDDWKYAYASVL